ncbi:MAG: bacterial transcriptional activator domain-containing protein, partial [Nitrospirota bacterium]
TAELSPLAFMIVKMQEAVHSWHVADFDMCLGAVHEGLEEAERSGVHIFDNWLLSQEVYARLFLDEPERAKVSLDRIKPVLNSRRYLDISQFYYQSSLYNMRIGNMELALQHNGEALRFAQDMGTPFPEGLNIITSAQIHFEMGDVGKAEELNNRARDIGRDMQSHLLNMLSNLNEAYFSLKTGKHENTRGPLRTALEIGKEKGIINLPGWRSPLMTELYSEALRSGIEVDYVRDIIRRMDVLPEKSSIELENWPWQMKIYTLGRFETMIDGEPLRFKGKPQLKPLEMLKALIALGGRDVGQNRLEDLLWPETDGDRSRQALITTLYRLRKIAGNEKVIELSERKLSLNDNYCWTDVWAFDNLYNKIDDVFAADSFDKSEAAPLTEAMLTLYRGDFLIDEDDASWAWPARTRIRSRFLYMLGTSARGWEKQSSFEKAVDLYLRGLEVDELAEEFYRGLMKCYQRQGRTAEGLAVYERCREVLASSLQITPSPETEEIYRSLRQGRATG